MCIRDRKEVIPLLNGLKPALLCVRGNCDAEVDQMVLDFPILADYEMCIRDRVVAEQQRAVGDVQVRIILVKAGPVSYTHLDVYKRQAPYRPAALPARQVGGSSSSGRSGCVPDAV